MPHRLARKKYFDRRWASNSSSRQTVETPARYDEGTAAQNHNAATTERGYYNIQLFSCQPANSTPSAAELTAVRQTVSPNKFVTATYTGISQTKRIAPTTNGYIP